VIAAKTNLQESDVEEYVQDMIQTRKVDVNNLTEEQIKISIDKLMEYKNMMLGTISSRTQEQLK
jgi:hypothetical protein